ncbi:UPF0420 protein C16orf58, partial [Operophtera brumata]
QAGIVVVSSSGKTDANDWLQSIFLPQGYPDSVSKDYLAYQIWDTAQAFCSTISGILATQEVLRGVGVGDANATPLAATITWILKDGCGYIGRILFAYSHGIYLDAYSKKWRIYADILNNAAMCIEIALPLFIDYASFALVAMTQHHAIIGNLADVSAKDSAQETAVNLVASGTALLILTIFGDDGAPRNVQLFCRKGSVPSDPQRAKIPACHRPIPEIRDHRICGFSIELGQSLSKVFKKNPQAAHLKKLSKIYEYRNYILVPNIQSKYMHVLIKEEANVQDVLCAYLHATLLAIITCAINDIPLPVYTNETNEERPFAQVCRTLQSVEWSRYEAHIPNCGFAYDPSYELTRYLDKIVQKEWPKVSAGLSQTEEMKDKNIQSDSAHEIQSEPFQDVVELENQEKNDGVFTIEPSLLMLPSDSNTELPFLYSNL